VVGGTGWLLVLWAVHSYARVGFLGLLPGFLLAGIGLGLVVAPMFDIILAAVEDRESGSASGVLNAGQQLATSVGVAVLGTVFFDSLGAGHFHRAIGHVLMVQAGSAVALLALSTLLPRFARPETSAH
jgi:predicted MFS family arabinose efflux permease